MFVEHLSYKECDESESLDGHLTKFILVLFPKLQLHNSTDILALQQTCVLGKMNTTLRLASVCTEVVSTAERQ